MIQERLILMQEESSDEHDKPEYIKLFKRAVFYHVCLALYEDNEKYLKEVMEAFRDYICEKCIVRPTCDFSGDKLCDKAKDRIEETLVFDVGMNDIIISNKRVSNVVVCVGDDFSMGV